MTDVFFCSGWAGPETLFPEFTGRWTFFAPFLDGDEDALLTRLDACPATVLAGWSTGAHILLKHAATLVPRFARIVLFAPFSRFSDSLPARITQAMRSGMATDAAATVRGFWKNCGLPDARNAPGTLGPPGASRALGVDPAWTAPLTAGLDYLLSSTAPETPVPAANVTVLHGDADRIVRRAAVQKALALLPGAAFREFSGGHLPDPATITDALFR